MVQSPAQRLRVRDAGLQRHHHPVEHEADQADDDHGDHDPGERLLVAVLELVPDELAEAGVLREHFRRDQHHPAHAQRQAHAGEDIGQRRWQDELGQLATSRSRSTRPTLSRSLSIDAVPTAVLISVGHSEHSITTTAEMTKLLGRASDRIVIDAETTIVTIGSQASGDTGWMTWTSGLIAALNACDMPHMRPSGTAISDASRKPISDRLERGQDLVEKVGGPV